MTDTRAKSKARSDVLYSLAMAAHLNQRVWVRKALDAFDEYCRLDPAQIPAKGRTVCLHCGKPYEEVSSDAVH